MYCTHTHNDKTVGWAGHAGGGTDVQANRVIMGGGALTERGGGDLATEEEEVSEPDA